jgi:hypothetical protein
LEVNYWTLRLMDRIEIDRTATILPYKKFVDHLVLLNESRNSNMDILLIDNCDGCFTIGHVV